MSVSASAVVEPRLRIAHVDGLRAWRGLRAGLLRVISDQEHLNKINVYPVADGDTGTNLACTMQSVRDALRGSAETHLGRTLTLIADAALDGARGNSGAIFAQFLQGVADALEDTARAEPAEFAAAVAAGAQFAREAVSEPVEGTILTVMSEFAATCIEAAATPGTDFVALLDQGLASAKSALARTPDQLAVLRKAGVVDAGAEGFVDFVAGIHTLVLTGEEIDPTTLGHSEPELSYATAGENDGEYRYCTECMIGGGADRRKLREALAPLGGSLVIAGIHAKVRAHIHTNDPGAVFELAESFGEVSATKADDMLRQQDSRPSQKRAVAIVMDSSGDISEDEMERLNIHVAPLRVHFGSRSYLDKVTISADDFYSELANNPITPTTSQPAPGDLRRQYQYLISHFDSVVSVHVSAAASGTFRAAESAAERSADPKRVLTLDSGNVSVGLGLLTLYAAECAAAGYNGREVAAAVEEMRPLTQTYAVIRDLRYVVRGGRIPAWVKRVADVLHLSPVLGNKPDGSLGARGLLLGRTGIVDKLARYVAKRLDARQSYRLAVAHANCEADAQALLARLQDLVPNLHSTLLTRVGSALGVHAGPGGIVVGVQPFVAP